MTNQEKVSNRSDQKDKYALKDKMLAMIGAGAIIASMSACGEKVGAEQPTSDVETSQSAEPTEKPAEKVNNDRSGEKFDEALNELKNTLEPISWDAPLEDKINHQRYCMAKSETFGFETEEEAAITDAKIGSVIDSMSGYDQTIYTNPVDAATDVVLQEIKDAFDAECYVSEEERGDGLRYELGRRDEIQLNVAWIMLDPNYDPNNPDQNKVLDIRADILSLEELPSNDTQTQVVRVKKLEYIYDTGEELSEFTQVITFKRVTDEQGREVSLIQDIVHQGDSVSR